MVRVGGLAALVFILFSAGAATSAFAQDEAQLAFAGEQVRVTRFASGLENPWAIAFLPDGQLLVTERAGRMRVVSRDGHLSAPIEGVPRVHARGKGGLLDVALDPDFAQSRLVFFSYAEPRPDGSGTAVARGRLSSDMTRLDDVTVIFRQVPSGIGHNHFGSRFIFAPDGTLFVTLGDRYGLRDRAQDLSTTLGKVIRINKDGSIPADNPFRHTEGASPEIWSYGHRNVQAAALDPRDGKLWTVEHGPRGGDEVNITEAGKNYGWPIITYGREYSGGKIGEGTAKEGMEQPVFYWDPSIAPSGAAFYGAALFPHWKGSLFVGALAGKSLICLTVEGDKVTGEERLSLGKRVRDVRQGPDGALWLATDAKDGEILRVVPAQ